MGFQLVGGICVPDNAYPRPITPLSLGDVTLRRPTLRWELSDGFDGAVVELCRDRPCAAVIETIRAVGTSARPSADLAPRSVVFWRLRGRVGIAESGTNSPTWLFHQGSGILWLALTNTKDKTHTRVGAPSVYAPADEGTADATA